MSFPLLIALIGGGYFWKLRCESWHPFFFFAGVCACV